MTLIPEGWTLEPLINHVASRSGDSKIIKGKQSSSHQAGLVQGFSASGPDVWVPKAQWQGPGIVVSAVGARCGKTFEAHGEWTAIANTHVLVPSDNSAVDFKWLWYLTNDEDFWIRSGTAQPFVKVKDTLLRPQLIPPLDEQRRIVETLDEHLSRLDKALAELESSSRLRNNFKDSLIHGIVSGHYSDNLSNWQVATLGQVAKWSSGGTPQSGNPNYYGGQIPWCVIGDLTESLVTETAKTITDEGLAASSAKIVNPGTVLLAMYGASIGRTGISGIPMATNQAIACAVPNANLDPNYLLLYLQSQKRMFIESGRGGAQPNISQTIIKEWALNLPPIEEQKRLLRLAESHQATIKSLSELALKLENQYLTLRRSLLNAAFSGGLVA